MLLIRCAWNEESKLLKINPAIAMMAMTMGKIAVMRLNASPAAKVMTQSLFILVQKAGRILIFFFAICLASVAFLGSVCSDDSFIWVGITDNSSQDSPMTSVTSDANVTNADLPTGHCDSALTKLAQLFDYSR